MNKITKIILTVFLAVSLMGVAQAAVSIDSMTVSDDDNWLRAGTTYTFNVSVSVDNLAKNATSCNLNGVSLTSPGGNGSGKWTYTGTVNSFEPTMADCRNNVTANCTLADGSTIASTNSAWTALPCVNESDDWSRISVSHVGDYVHADTPTYTDSTSTVNNTIINSTTYNYSSTECDLTSGGSSFTFTARIPLSAYNDSYGFGSHDCVVVDNNEIKVDEVGYLDASEPETSPVSKTQLGLIIVFGAGALAAGYGVGSRRRK